MLENIPYTIDKYDVSACTLIMKYLATHMKNNNTHKKENKEVEILETKIFKIFLRFYFTIIDFLKYSFFFPGLCFNLRKFLKVPCDPSFAFLCYLDIDK